MLYLLFSIGKDHYAFPAKDVVEVLPLIELRAMPHAPAGIAGLFDYHGQAVPVIDLSIILSGKPSPQVMTTRLAVANYRSDSGEDHLLGILAEHLTDTVKADESQFQSSGVHAAEAQYLDKVMSKSGDLVQRINLTELLPVEVRSSLFQQAAAEL